jgi:hypothetical protein
MMSNKMINRKQRFFALRRTHVAGMAILLVILVLGVLGHWDLALTMVGMVIFLSISMLLFSTARQVNRDYGFHDNRLPFYLTFYNMLNSVVDPRPSRSEQERIERQQEDFKPFVFKEHAEDGGYKYL